ncbi:DNA mismatch endonuclease Vsr [Achromobacter ruhlandii]|uniref:DNA mismatch endonuclease Vsr n=1 Tax=Achromobacter ruhlandii TaxID=72557 RepID=UPI003BA38F30
MADVFDRTKRSAVMAKIRGTGNRSTELTMVRGFRSAHVTGWRRHVTFTFRVQAPTGSVAAANTQVVKVRPDFIFRSERVAIFVDGCFWHCCPLHSKVPESNRSFWEPKLQANVARDRRATRLLRDAGWSVLRVWEHELRDMERIVKRVERRLKAIRLPS